VKRLFAEPLEWVLLAVLVSIAALMLTGCDSVARATAAPDLTVIVNVPSPPEGGHYAPAVPTPPIDAPDGIADSGNLPPSEPSPDTCEKNGRGDGNGTPGNGKGQGDEHGGCADR
jgi:hypothetical protein